MTLLILTGCSDLGAVIMLLLSRRKPADIFFMGNCIKKNQIKKTKHRFTNFYKSRFSREKVIINFIITFSFKKLLFLNFLNAQVSSTRKPQLSTSWTSAAFVMCLWIKIRKITSEIYLLTCNCLKRNLDKPQDCESKMVISLLIICLNIREEVHVHCEEKRIISPFSHQFYIGMD